MATHLTFAHAGLILDACCIINLYATRRMEDILKAIPESVAIADYAREEVGWIYRGPDSNVTRTRGKIDLQPFVELGLLTIVSLNSEPEQNTFVSFAVDLDDGETVTGAIAVHRNWAIATDDKKATSFFINKAPHLQIISTPELIKYWVDTTHPSNEVVRVTLQNVWLRARYKPHDQHPLYEWWYQRSSVK